MIDHMKGSKFFSPLDLASAYHQLELKEKDKHKTALRDPTGRLLESNVCSFAIITIPVVFSATLGDNLKEVLDKVVDKWLDDIVLYTEMLEEQFRLLRKALSLLQKGRGTVHFHKSEFFFPELEFLGVMVGNDGTRPAPSKIKTVQELEMPQDRGRGERFPGDHRASARFRPQPQRHLSADLRSPAKQGVQL